MVCRSQTSFFSFFFNRLFAGSFDIRTGWSVKSLVRLGKSLVFFGSEISFRCDVDVVLFFYWAARKENFKTPC